MTGTRLGARPRAGGGGTPGRAGGDEAADRNRVRPDGEAGPSGDSPNTALTVAILVHGEVFASRLM